ncbi:hypothetical protein BH10PSE16_BH10PSE16_42650 [soil metagenome]
MKLHSLHVEFASLRPDLAAARAAGVVVLAGDIHQGARGMAWARQAFAGNPRGYPLGWLESEFENARFDAAFTVEVECE